MIQWRMLRRRATWLSLLLALLSIVGWGLLPTGPTGTFSLAQEAASVTAPSVAPPPPTVSPPSSAPSASAPRDHTRREGVPDKAFDVLAQIQARNGQPPIGYIGGRTFENRERHLPRGRYREYDVNPKIPGRNRGAERLVIEQRTGKAFYTGDHYRTFTPLN